MMSFFKNILKFKNSDNNPTGPGTLVAQTCETYYEIEIFKYKPVDTLHHRPLRKENVLVTVLTGNRFQESSLFG